MNLVSVIMQFLTPSLVGKIASSLGLQQTLVQKATNERLAEWLEENPVEANRMVKKAQAAGTGAPLLTLGATSMTGDWQVNTNTDATTTDEKIAAPAEPNKASPTWAANVSSLVILATGTRYIKTPLTAM